MTRPSAPPPPAPTRPGPAAAPGPELGAWPGAGPGAEAAPSARRPGEDRSGRPGFASTVAAYARSDSLILWRLRTPIAFMLAVPALLAFTLGPAVSGSSPADGGRGRSLIGIAVMFSFITVNYAGLALFREFNNNTWIRQAVCRPAASAYLLGKLLPTALAGLIQLTIFGAIAFLGYRTPLHGNVVQLCLVAAALVAVGCALGGVLHCLTNTTTVFQSLAYVILIATGCVGGALVPPDRLPRASRLVGVVTPQHWAMTALDAATTGSGAWGPTLEAVGVMGATAALLTAVTLRMLNFGTEKSTL